MAAGNWAYEYFLIEGKKEDGHRLSAETYNYSICLYKNWIYLFKKDGGEDNTIGELHSGYLTLENLRITAVRGPQNGIYAIIENGYEGQEKYYVIFWIGAYAYKENDFIGIGDEAKSFMDILISKYKKGNKII